MKLNQDRLAIILGIGAVITAVIDAIFNKL
jgi:hypothetical protein